MRPTMMNVRPTAAFMLEQERLAREACEMWRQKDLEMRRHALRRFGPAVDGVLWSRSRPEGEADESPHTPLLSILDLALKPSVDILDESKPSRRLWDACLRYISSIPGYSAVEWGPVLGPELAYPPATPKLLCMIHWDSVVAWRKFQQSLGFSPFLGLLLPSPSNRCAKVGVPGAPCFSNTRDGQGAPVVDVVTVDFAAKDVSSPERRAAVEEMWDTLVASVTNGSDGLRHSSAVWLENNATIVADPTPAETAAAATLATFTAFLAWDREHYNSHLIEQICDNLQDAVPSPSNEPTITRKTVQLVNNTHQPSHNLRQRPAAPLANLASLVNVEFPRQCGADLFHLREHERQAIARSISDARARTRLFPGPHGFFISQGELYDAYMPPIPLWLHRGPSLGHDLMDVVWMQLKRGALRRTQGPHICNYLRDEASALPGFVQTFWATDLENKAKLAVMAVWESQDARAAALPEYRRILDAFAASSVHLAAPLKHQAFPKARTYVNSWPNIRECLELTCFHVPPGALERKLFEHAFGAFVRMTEPSVVAGIPVACIVDDTGGWQPEPDENSGCQVFTGVVFWNSAAARAEWYGELFRLSCESYELFGQKLDALKILATGGVVTRFLELQGQ